MQYHHWSDPVRSIVARGSRDTTYPHISGHPMAGPIQWSLVWLRLWRTNWRPEISGYPLVWNWSINHHFSYWPRCIFAFHVWTRIYGVERIAKNVYYSMGQRNEVTTNSHYYFLRRWVNFLDKSNKSFLHTFYPLWHTHLFLIHNFTHTLSLTPYTCLQGWIWKLALAPALQDSRW